MLKPSQNISEIIGVSLWPSSSLDFNPLDYAAWGILENKTNATFHTSISSLKTIIELEWNNISDEFILKACKSFQSHGDKIIEKKVAIFSKFTNLCLERIYDLLNAETRQKFLCLPYTKQRQYFKEKEPFKEKVEWRIKQKMKKKVSSW